MQIMVMNISKSPAWRLRDALGAYSLSLAQPQMKSACTGREFSVPVRAQVLHICQAAGNLGLTPTRWGVSVFLLKCVHWGCLPFKGERGYFGPNSLSVHLHGAPLSQC